ncbi:MAG: flagellar export chaperone FlgN [Treponema sp.]|nr:flagellar export chaperone FlgN [Treponema sp.]
MAAALNNKKAIPAEIDSAELAQRVAVLKRFKTLLTQQRDRFRSYLDLLDKQQDVIESGSAEDLLTYVEIEEKIVADIFSIQKVIDPLEEMYNSVISDKSLTKSASGADDAEVPSLKASLDKLQSEAIMRSTKNKELLSKRMLELRQEIKTLRTNPYVVSNRRSSYSGANSASLVDLQG